MRAPVHRPFGWRPAHRRKQPSDAYYVSKEWRELRAAVLKRDHYRCRIGLPGCRIRANTVDHILDRERGGADADYNLRACCAPCHNRRHPEKGQG